MVYFALIFVTKVILYYLYYLAIQKATSLILQRY